MIFPLWCDRVEGVGLSSFVSRYTKPKRTARDILAAGHGRESSPFAERSGP